MCAKQAPKHGEPFPLVFNTMLFSVAPHLGSEKWPTLNEEDCNGNFDFGFATQQTHTHSNTHTHTHTHRFTRGFGGWMTKQANRCFAACVLWPSCTNHLHSHTQQRKQRAETRGEENEWDWQTGTLCWARATTPELGLCRRALLCWPCLLSPSL